jgi:DNA-binding PadR family transcriptional regulator
MGFSPMDFIYGSKNKIPANIKKEKMYTLTNSGREQVEELRGDEQDFGLLATMKNRHAWSLDDLSHEVKLPTRKVFEDIKRNQARGFIKVANAEGD